MAIKEPIRTGGRSARVQQSIHQAVHALLREHAREQLTVPMIALRAGVTPSTLYRRWGDLPALLADVALARFQPDTEPADTGALKSDLQAWLEQYCDEISSAPGRAMIRDFIASDRSGQCATVLRAQLNTILKRARHRGEAVPDVEHLLDRLVSPVVYRVLFSEALPTSEQLAAWVEGL